MRLISFLTILAVASAASPLQPPKALARLAPSKSLPQSPASLTTTISGGAVAASPSTTSIAALSVLGGFMAHLTFGTMYCWG